MKINSPPKEGDIYKTIKIDEYTFELKYGYYEDFERENCEPVVIYPFFDEIIYTKEGYPIITAIQEPCEFYEISDSKSADFSCVDCIHYSPPGDDIGICKCSKRQKKKYGEGV